jgi:hypothetical protein
MKKMQRGYLKFVALLIIALSVSSFHCVFSQVSSFRLKTADSLYQMKKYTQSFEHYQEILRQKQYTPIMLLKMAYIQEGLGNTGEAMYYLNLYFLATNDKTVLEKMEELADKFDLEGYETSDADRVLTFYHDYYTQISYGLVAVSVLLLSIVFYTKTKLQQKPIAGTIFLMVFLIAFFVHINFGRSIKTAIISHANTYIMDGPSPGASLITIASGGHRVEVIGKKDVWLKIRWNGEIAYVKENSLLAIQL